MEAVWHTQCATKQLLWNISEITLQNPLNRVELFCAHRQLEIRKTIGNNGIVWNVPNSRHTDVQLTSCSDFIPGSNVGTGSSSCSTSETVSVFILMPPFPSWEDAGHISLHKPGTPFSKSMQFCKPTQHGHGCALITTKRALSYYNSFALHQTNNSCFVHIFFLRGIKIIHLLVVTRLKMV
jgi:hypothetical protein